MGTRTFRAACALLLAGLAASTAIAGGPAAARKQTEASMLVTGSIDIAPDGSVAGYALDKPEALPEPVKALSARAIPHWRFRPVIVDGSPVLARSGMTVRYVVTRQDDGNFAMRISAAAFGGGEGEDAGKRAGKGHPIAERDMPPPTYPLEAQRAGVTGTVYIVAHVARDGSVEDAIAERVNLRVAGNEQQMRYARKLLGHAALAAARRWTFVPPTGTEAARRDHWDVRVPVTFLMQGQEPAAYGQWDVYVPGPAKRAPWLPPEQEVGSDALLAGHIYPVGEGPKLLTDLAGDAG